MVQKCPGIKSTSPCPFLILIEFGFDNFYGSLRSDLGRGKKDLEDGGDLCHHLLKQARIASCVNDIETSNISFFTQHCKNVMFGNIANHAFLVLIFSAKNCVGAISFYFCNYA